MRRSYLIFFICAGIFSALSYVIYQQVPIDWKAHLDVDSSAYVRDALFFYKDSSFIARETCPHYGLGYAFFIGMVYKFFGQTGGAIVFCQLLLVMLSGLLLFCITNRLFGRLAGLISVFLLSINLGYLVFVQFVLTEILLAFFFIAFFERFTAFLVAKNYWSLVSAGLLLGASIAVKPAALYAVIALAPVILCMKHIRLIQKILALIIFAASFSLPVLGYMQHNYLMFGTFRIGSLDDVNIYYWLLPNVLAEKHDSDSNVERLKIWEFEGKYGKSHIKNMLMQELKNNPGRLIYVWLKNVIKTWLGLFSTNLKVLVDRSTFSGGISFFRVQGSFLDRVMHYVTASTALTWVKVISCLEVVWSALRLFFGIFGLLFLLRNRFLLGFFVVTYLAYFSMITGHDGCARFRMMFEFVLILLAAGGLALVRERTKNKNTIVGATKSSF